MEKKNKIVKSKASGLVKTLYVIAALLMAICIYMIVINILYIRSYAESYGVTVSSMMMDAVQYVITGSISYFIYGVLVFSAGKIIRLLQSRGQVLPEESVLEEEENAAAEMLTEPEPEENADDGESENDIPQSEDAIEETKVISKI